MVGRPDLRPDVRDMRDMRDMRNSFFVFFRYYKSGAGIEDGDPGGQRWLPLGY